VVATSWPGSLPLNSLPFKSRTASVATMKKSKGRGGPRRGAGRPKGPESELRCHRVAVLLTAGELATLERLAEAQQLPLGTVAYGFVARGLRRAGAGTR